MSKSFNTKEINKKFFELFNSKSRSEMAALLGVSQGMLSAWSKGKKQVPWDKLALAKELSGKSWDWMLASGGSELSANGTAPTQSGDKGQGVPRKITLPPVAEIRSPHGRRITLQGGELPVRGRAAADDSGGTRVPDADDFDEPIRMPSGLLGVPVIGDSMSPVALNGQLAMIDAEREGFERDGGIYVISVVEPEPGDDYPEPMVGTFVKRCLLRENLYYLESINTYSPFSVHVDHCRLWPVLGVWFNEKGAPPEGF